MALNFEKYAQEGSHFVNNLAKDLGHPEEKARTGIVLRSVLHAIRERLTVSESLHILSQLPMFLKSIYVDNWKYREKPLGLNTTEDLLKEVENYQEQYGESDFDWNKTTAEIVQIVLRALGAFISEGEFRHIIAQMPEQLAEFLSKSLTGKK